MIDDDDDDDDDDYGHGTWSLALNIVGIWEQGAQEYTVT
jgi:hypothetical protein